MFLTCEKYCEAYQRLIQLFLHVKKNVSVFPATAVNGQPTLPAITSQSRQTWPPRTTMRFTLDVLDSDFFSFSKRKWPLDILSYIYP